MSGSGTPRKVTLKGETFNIAFDANFARTPDVTTEGVRHTGGVMMKTTLNVATVESVTLVATGAQYQRLRELSKSEVDFNMSYELASGDVYRSPGRINLDNYESEERRVDVQLIPSDEWEEFLT